MEEKGEELRCEGEGDDARIVERKGISGAHVRRSGWTMVGKGAIVVKRDGGWLGGNSGGGDRRGGWRREMSSRETRVTTARRVVSRVGGGSVRFAPVVLVVMVAAREKGEDDGEWWYLEGVQLVARVIGGGLDRRGFRHDGEVRFRVVVWFGWYEDGERRPEGWLAVEKAGTAWLHRGSRRRYGEGLISRQLGVQ